MKKALESPENKKCIKAINFDLETKRVKEIFHSNSPYIYLKAYQLVSKFLKSNDFKHRQFSGYISSKKMSDAEILNMVAVEICSKLRPDLAKFFTVVVHFSFFYFHCKSMSFHLCNPPVLMTFCYIFHYTFHNEQIYHLFCSHMI